LQAQAKRFGQLRQQDLKQIDRLTRALAHSEAKFAAAKLEDARRGPSHIGEGATDASATTPAAAVAAALASPPPPDDAAELRLQLAAAHDRMSHLRAQLADCGRETRGGSSAGWRRDEDVKKMMEEEYIRIKRNTKIVSALLLGTAVYFYFFHSLGADQEL
jgi:hypothetical protein